MRCPFCGSIDTLAWKRPPVGEIAMPTGTEMLPLIVGPSAENAEIVEVAEDVLTEEITEPTDTVVVETK